MTGDQLFESVLSDYSRHVNPYLARLMSFAGFGVEVRAEGCYIYDHDGREFLDCLGGYGVFALGHRHPKVVQAVQEQLNRMPLSGKAFFSEMQGALAAKLADVAPAGLEFTFFSNSGTEAVEAALKFAKGATGREKIVSTVAGYHGKTIGALSTTGREKYREQFEPLMPGADFVPFGDPDAITRAIDEHTACVIVEPIQGEGGIHVPPAGYLTAIRAACDRHGALMIADEVQTGLGRTGLMFECERDGVSPDIMTLAKSLGGGVMPIGATMGTQAVWDKIFAKNPLMHTSTFGGNPLACAAGLAALEVIQTERLVERAATSGAKLQAKLEDVKSKHQDMICAVRGRGLMLGVEFARDEVGELTIAQMMKRGLAAAYTLNNPRVIRFEPPLIITDSQIEHAASMFAEALTETSDILAALV